MKHRIVTWQAGGRKSRGGRETSLSRSSKRPQSGEHEPSDAFIGWKRFTVVEGSRDWGTARFWGLMKGLGPGIRGLG